MMTGALVGGAVVVGGADGGGVGVGVQPQPKTAVISNMQISRFISVQLPQRHIVGALENALRVIAKHPGYQLSYRMICWRVGT